MLRRLVLAVAGLVMPSLLSAAEVPIAELASAPFVSETPVRPSFVPALTQAPAARLVWLDPVGSALGTEAIVRSEVSRLLREMGVASSWRRGEPQELARPGELRVIFLNRGTQREHAPVLGATPSSFQGERFLWVHVPSVRNAAEVASQKTGPSLDIHSARRLGIALARVIAHEVVHAVAPGVPHGTGLMSARLDRRMLTAASIAIEPRVGFAVRAALVAAPPAPRPADTILAAESSHAAESSYAAESSHAAESTYKEPYR